MTWDWCVIHIQNSANIINVHLEEGSQSEHHPDGDA